METINPNEKLLGLCDHGNQPDSCPTCLEAHARETSNEGESEVVETRERNFKAWFGNSKMVDAEGKPKIFYHGTRKAFDVFDKTHLRVLGDGDPAQNAMGFFFAESKEYASEIYGGFKEPMAVYLKIEKPYLLSGREYVSLDTAEKVEEFLRDIKSHGYDGVIIADGTENVAFESTQIKSVNNKGTFDPNDVNINH